MTKREGEPVTCLSVVLNHGTVDAPRFEDLVEKVVPRYRRNWRESAVALQRDLAVGPAIGAHPMRKTLVLTGVLEY